MFSGCPVVCAFIRSFVQTDVTTISPEWLEQCG